MASQPFLPLYTGDWKKDPCLSLCSPATRGIWIDMLCSLHDTQVGQITGTPEQLARLCRCDPGSMHAALSELQATGAANVSERETIFTISCRRMKKAYELSKIRAESGSKGGAKRKQKSQPLEYEDEDDGKKKVRDFATVVGISNSDADWFFFKCHGNGWTNGGRPILDWRMTLRSWKSAGYLPSQKNGNGRDQPI